ncbi:NAD(+)/NADH kinase [Candidatus Aerophobetes bacterium]|nr:NAD(+)/NADH kinase [Candidatus Aerophobetes bacterium]
MIKKIGITLNPTKQDILERTESIIRWLNKRGIKVLILDSVAAQGYLIKMHTPVEKISKEAELIISLGGDGTLCRCARIFSPAGIPILGVNMGGLGFLTETPIDEFEESFEKLLSGEYTIEQRMMLQSRITHGNFKNKSKSFSALNDVVISKSSLPRIVSLKTFVCGEFVTTYSADGLIISTPTGSTAYSLSAGGPIVEPCLNVIILAPICAHTLSVRPLIISEKETIKVVPLAPAEDIFFTIDGQETHPVKEEEAVEVKKSPYPAKLVRFKEKSFFEILQTKLGWSGITYKANEKE